MSKQALLWSGLGVVALTAVIIFVIPSLTSQESASNPDVEGQASSSAGFVPELVNAAYQYDQDDELYTVAGEAEVKDGCTQLRQQVSAPDDSATTTIELATYNPTPDAVCTQAITTARFKSTFNGPEDTEIDMTYNGEPVELNLREAGPDEDLDDFEVYSKG